MNGSYISKEVVVKKKKSSQVNVNGMASPPCLWLIEWMILT